MPSKFRKSHCKACIFFLLPSSCFRKAAMNCLHLSLSCNCSQGIHNAFLPPNLRCLDGIQPSNTIRFKLFRLMMWPKNVSFLNMVVSFPSYSIQYCIIFRVALLRNSLHFPPNPHLKGSNPIHHIIRYSPSSAP